MKAAIYARVSTEKQTADMQLTDLRSYVQRMGWTAVEYLESESSMKRRPVFERMMTDARARKFDVVLVWAIDRFARSMKQFINAVLELNAAGVALTSITQNISTNQKDPMGQFVLGLFGLLAELERSIIVERVKAGVTEYGRAYAAGEIGKTRHSRSGKDLPPGRPKRVFHRDEAEKLRKLGHSWRSIAKHLGVSASTLQSALSH